MDKIFFRNLRFYGYHGVFQHEKLRGQYFELDVELGCELQSAGRSGQLGNSIDYGALYQFVKMVVTEQRFSLLEELGEYLCEQILEQFTKAESIVLRLRKPEAPLENGIIPDRILAETMPAVCRPGNRAILVKVGVLASNCIAVGRANTLAMIDWDQLMKKDRVKSGTALLPFQSTAYLSLGSNLGRRKRILTASSRIVGLPPSDRSSTMFFRI